MSTNPQDDDEFAHLKAQYDALQKRALKPKLPKLADLPRADISTFRACLREMTPPLVVTRYGEPIWVIWTADSYEEDFAA